VALLCRSVADPQHDLSAPASPSRMRSADPKVVGESLVDDAQIATPPRGAAESSNFTASGEFKGGESSAHY
jgi:hypothetical protein